MMAAFEYRDRPLFKCKTCGEHRERFCPCDDLDEHPRRRVRNYVITLEDFTDLFVEGGEGRLEHDAPAGSRLVNLGYDPQQMAVYLTLTHHSFAPVSEGEIIPRYPISLDTVRSWGWAP